MHIEKDVYDCAKKWLFYAELLTIFGRFAFLLTWMHNFNVTASSGLCEFSDKCMSVPTYHKMKVAYKDFGVNGRYPFNSSCDEYWFECADKHCHLNQRRICFVKNLIEVYEFGMQYETT